VGAVAIGAGIVLERTQRLPVAVPAD